MNEIEEKNFRGELALNNILTHPERYSKANKFRGIDFLIPDGVGISYDSQGEFRGFFRFYCHDDFRIQILGDLELNELNADIYYRDVIFAVLTQENGYENMLIDLYLPKRGEERLFLTLQQFYTMIFEANSLLRP